MIQVIGSFATVWIGLWLALTLTLIATYPLIRNTLFKLRSDYASNVLLVLIAIPVLLSLVSSVLLFLPIFDGILVREHCHDNCGEHLPLLDSALLNWPGLIFLSAFIIYFTYKLGQQLRFAHRLNQQLLALSDPQPSCDYRLLADQQALVFTVGWWRNTIYVSAGIQNACSEEELAIVATHEQAHGERKDNLRIMAARLFTLLLPSSIAGNLLNDLQLLIESACDAKAAEKFGAINVAQTFVKIQRLMPTANKLPYGVSALNGSPIEQRVHALLNNDTLLRTPSKSSTYVGIVCLLAGLVISIDPLHHLIELLLGLH